MVDIFPTNLTEITTIAWPVLKTPNWHSRRQRAVSGRTLYTQDYAYPIWEWTITFELLKDANDYRYLYQGSIFYNSAPFGDLRKLQGFYNTHQANNQVFLFWDQADMTAGTPALPGTPAFTQVIGVGDGSTTVFPLVRSAASTLAGGTSGGTEGLGEPVHAAIYNNEATLIAPMGLTSAAFNIYDNGSLTTAYTTLSHAEFGLANAVYAIQFSSPPVAGHTITGEYFFYWPARFSDDNYEFENFLLGRWRVGKMKLESVLMDIGA